MKAVTFSGLLESLRLHSDSGAFCDRSNSQPVPGPDGESQTTALRLRAIMSTQYRKNAQANAYHWLDQWHTSTLVIGQIQFCQTQQKKENVLNMENNTTSHQVTILKFTIRTEQTLQTHTTEYQPSLPA
jgi:hypothetical protein